MTAPTFRERACFLLYGTRPAPSIKGVASWAHDAVAAATVLRRADGQDGEPRVAFIGSPLGSVIWTGGAASQAEIRERVAAAWPELPDPEIARIASHIDARAHLALQSRPSEDTMQDHRRSRNWVTSWKEDRA